MNKGKKAILTVWVAGIILTGLYLIPGIQRKLPPLLQWPSYQLDARIDDIRDDKKNYRYHEITPPTFKDLRSQLLTALTNATYNRAYREAAMINSILAAEALSRAHSTLVFWIGKQDPETKLFPGYLHAEIQFWDYQNVGADLFPFLTMAAYYLHDQAFGSLIDTLKSEERITHPFPLPKTIILGEGTTVDEGQEERIFATSEYIKDGLIPLTEKLGRGPWFERMEFLMKKLWEVAPVKTPYGPIPSNQAEINGELLQSLCRLYQATRKDNYFRWAERIGDVYLLEILPENSFLPPKYWNFEKGRATSDEVWLRDHGNELITGLAELVCLECLLSRSRCDTYLSPLLTMMDLLLEKGRNSDGIWVNAIDRSGKHLKAKKGMLCDNWGYLYAAYLAVAQVLEHKGIHLEKAQHYRDEAERCLKNIHHYRYTPWERQHEMDGLADTLESALYLLNRIPETSAFNWVDEEMGILLSLQNPDGSVNKDYLDGNFIRTVLLYGLYKTQGVYLKPWREHLRWGAFLHADTLYLYLETEDTWSGKLFFDYPRHFHHWNFIINYPRVNEWPEWYVVEEEKHYRITSLQEGTSQVYSGTTLLNGITFSLNEHSSATLLIEKEEDKGDPESPKGTASPRTTLRNVYLPESGHRDQQ